MRTLIIIVLVSFWALTSCRQETNTGKQKAAHKSTFTFQRYDIDLDTSIKNVEIFNNNIICLLGNGKIVVLDSTYKRNYNAENKLNIRDTVYWTYILNNHLLCGIKNSTMIFDSTYIHCKVTEAAFKKIGSIYVELFQDTVWVYNNKETYILDSSLNLHYYSNLPPYVNREMFGASELYNDSLYWIYGCSEGEFGGNLFFQSKKTKQIRTYPAYSPRIAFNLDGTYWIIETLGHMHGSTSYLKIKRPDSLPVWHKLSTLEKNVFCCSCKEENDTLDIEQDQTKNGNKYYFHEVSTLTALSFISNGKLYSLQLHDSVTKIVQHLGDTVCVVDTFLLTNANRYAHYFFERHDKNLSYCRMVGDTWFGNNGDAGYISYSGILIVKGKKIDLIEYYKNTSSYK